MPAQPVRPSLEAIPAASSSSTIILTQRSVPLYALFSRLTFFVVTAKIDEDLGKVYACIEELGGKYVGLEQAMFVITALQGRPRLAKALGVEWLASLSKSQKTILKTEYIFDTFERCLEAANVATIAPPSLPDRQKYLVNLAPPRPAKPKVPFMLESDSESEEEQGRGSGSTRPRKRQRRDSVHKFREGSPNWVGETCVLPDMDLYPLDIKLQDIPKRCVERPNPLVCVNQDIIDAIKPIYEDREFEELEQKNSNVLSYRRSMSILKAVPKRIRSGREARKLVDVGERVATRIDEYLTTGRIAESEEILGSAKYAALTAFASIYTIGHHKARELYDKYGCRTLGDVVTYFESKDGEQITMKERLKRRREGGMSHMDIVSEWMRLKDDLDSRIPREEVREITACVMEHLGAFMPGCEHTICGGYRRGKPQAGDVDIVFCPPEGVSDYMVLKNLYLRLSDLGLITHVLHVTQRDPNTPIHASAQNFDNLDKAFVIFKLPGPGRKHRRVDLISSPRERYAAAVLSWSGSMMFERDLKRVAEDQGIKFRAGLIRVSTGEEINLPTERQIFAYLGLRYVPPTLRNADG